MISVNNSKTKKTDNKYPVFHLCLGCIQAMYDECGTDLGFTENILIKFVERENCDYWQREDGSFNQSDRKIEEVRYGQ